MMTLASGAGVSHLTQMNITDSILVGKLLIAMPDMSDPRFANTVIYMCAHSDEGGMGLIINKPQSEIKFAKLLKQMDIPVAAGVRDIKVHFGGPVESQRGFVLHSNDYASENGTLDVDDTFRMTATLEVLEDIGKGEGPSISMMALGYAGWGPGQLEYEISQNGWLTCPPDEKIVFGSNDATKWTDALKSMGIDPLLLSATAGRA
jgi:putative transcriptional regulator